MRSEEQENRLKLLLYQRDMAEGRGVGMPAGIGKEIASLSAGAAFFPGRAVPLGKADPLGKAAPAALGYGGWAPAYGGTRFSPVIEGLSAQGHWQALGTQRWNKRQQELFKARSPKQTVFV